MMDNKTLKARCRARERDISIGGHTYTVRRPKVAEMMGDMTRLELARSFTVGWSLKNGDLQPGGTPDPEPFDPALWADYLEDEEDLWVPLSDAIMALWNEHRVARGTAEKN